jgi:GMP synthase (glutamine-hydrolysing)
MLGGPMNVYEEDKYSFLKKEDDFISRLIVEEIPFLGICLGAQLLAKACQARVRKAEVAEIGWSQVDLTREGRRDPLFLGATRCLNVFQWHEDTFEVPEGGVLLVKGKSCVNQAFRVGHHAYGVQFHFEATPQMISDWMKNEMHKVNVRRIRKIAVEKRDIFEQQANRLLVNFQRIMESSLRFKRIVKEYVDERRWADRRP